MAGYFVSVLQYCYPLTRTVFNFAYNSRYGMCYSSSYCNAIPCPCVKWSHLNYGEQNPKKSRKKTTRIERTKKKKTEETPMNRIKWPTKARLYNVPHSNP